MLHKQIFILNPKKSTSNIIYPLHAKLSKITQRFLVFKKINKMIKKNLKISKKSKKKIK